MNPIQLRKMEERRDELEDGIARCEAEITANELELANFKSAEETIRLNKQIEQDRGRLAGLMSEWEQVTRDLEQSGEVVSEDG